MAAPELMKMRVIKRVCAKMLSLVLPCLLLLSAPAFAKRTPAPVVQPVVYQGVRNEAPNDKGAAGYVEAWDVVSEKRLWKKTVFRKCICPLLEHDVQWVFIKRMWREDGRLILVTERNKTYALDLKTRRVQRIAMKPNHAR